MVDDSSLSGKRGNFSSKGLRRLVQEIQVSSSPAPSEVDRASSVVGIAGGKVTSAEARPGTGYRERDGRARYHHR